MNITLGRYVPFNSIIHKLDPRCKLFGMMALMTCIFIRFNSVAMNFLIYGIVAFVIIVLMVLAKVSFRSFVRSLKSLWFILIFLLIINSLMPNTGDYFLIFNRLRIYHNALYQTGYIFLRLVLMLSLTTILTSSTAPLDLTYALEWFMAPLKIVKFPVHEIAMTISIALRFIPTLLDETERIMKAQASRGVDFINGRFKEKIKALTALIIPLFVSAFQRSEELANAMEARGYNPSSKRTRYRVMRWKIKDSISAIVLLGFLASIIFVSAYKIDLIALITQAVN